MKHDVENLGELEMAVLQYVWDGGPTDVKAAHDDIGSQRGITHNTVQSTFKRLWEKGLLSRTKKGHAYIYGSLVSRRELTELMVSSLVGQIAGAEFSVALEAFVNLADREGEEVLDEMEQLIAMRRAEQGHRDE